MKQYHKVKVNNELFEVKIKPESTPKVPWIDYDHLLWVNPKNKNDFYPVTSTVLRDLFWNRYQGLVATQIREDENGKVK